MLDCCRRITLIPISRQRRPKVLRRVFEQMYLLANLDLPKGAQYHVGLQRPMIQGDGYLHNIFVNGIPSPGAYRICQNSSVEVAIFILIIACINFMNLATARSVKRAKEVGVRKVVGSTRGNLVGQFFGESLVFSFMAMLLSVILLLALLPAFNGFT